jgi:hypothetical protein
VFAVGVSAQLARRLLETGVVPAEEIYAALSDAVALGVPFVQALVTRGPETAELLDGELSRFRGPALDAVTVSLDLAAELPTGLCERLLAVPLGRASTGVIEVAAVDPLDPAVGTELARRLGAAVSVVRAPLGALLLALDRWLDERDRAAVRSSRTPAFGTRVVRRDATPALGPAYREPGTAGTPEPAGAHQSWPPIPLVRRSVSPGRQRVDTNPGVGAASRRVGHGLDETGTGVIGLYRSKAPPAPEERRPTEPDFTSLTRAESADDVVAALLEGARGLAARALVLVARGRTFEIRACAPAAPALDGVEVAGGLLAAVAAAVRDQRFLGRPGEDAAPEAAARFLGPDEVYLVPVNVGDRVPLCLLLSGLVATAESTRLADALARRAGQELERILRDRKRGS